MTKEEAQEIVKRQRPGWHAVDVTEVDDESGVFFEILIEQGANRRTLIIGASKEVVGERP